jgi:hypothetical protein
MGHHESFSPERVNKSLEKAGSSKATSSQKSAPRTPSKHLSR